MAYEYSQSQNQYKLHMRLSLWSKIWYCVLL